MPRTTALAVDECFYNYSFELSNFFQNGSIFAQKLSGRYDI
jgi:hypothetical protein